MAYDRGTGGGGPGAPKDISDRTRGNTKPVKPKKKKKIYSPSRKKRKVKAKRPKKGSGIEGGEATMPTRDKASGPQYSTGTPHYVGAPLSAPAGHPRYEVPNQQSPYPRQYPNDYDYRPPVYTTPGGVGPNPTARGPRTWTPSTASVSDRTRGGANAPYKPTYATSQEVQSLPKTPRMDFNIVGPYSPIQNVSAALSPQGTPAGNQANIGGQATSAVGGTAPRNRGGYGGSRGGYGGGGGGSSGGGAYEGYGMTDEWMNAYKTFWGQELPSDQYAMYQSITDLFARYANRIPQLHDWQRMWEAQRYEDPELSNMWAGIAPYDPMMQEQFVRQPLFTPPPVSYAPASSF